MQFDWDDKKNKANFEKREIWFEEAQTVWTDPNALEFFDPNHSEDEDRFIRVGFSTKARLLLVVFCENIDEQTTRIISARKAEPPEVKEYEKGIRPE